MSWVLGIFGIVIIIFQGETFIFGFKKSFVDFCPTSLKQAMSISIAAPTFVEHPLGLIWGKKQQNLHYLV